MQHNNYLTQKLSINVLNEGDGVTDLEVCRDNFLLFNLYCTQKGASYLKTLGPSTIMRSYSDLTEAAAVIYLFMPQLL